MRHYLIIVFIFIIQSLSAATYYVAPTTATPAGNDANAGTKTAPWATWGKGFSSTIPGDTVYFRGGVYQHTVTNGQGYRTINSGSTGNVTVYMAYLGETPILDCSNVEPTGTMSYALYASVNYVKFKGLTIRNLRQPDITVQVIAFRVTANNSVIENCTIHDADGLAFQCGAPTNSYYINCDAYNCFDPYGNTSGGMPGGRGTGFGIINASTSESSVYYIGCRAWNCGDQGFSGYSLGYMEYDNCWSFYNGHLNENGGHGFKFGFIPDEGDAAPLLRKVTNCIAAYNKQWGFNTNDKNERCITMQLYNNTAYKNGFHGFYFFNTIESDEQELKRIAINNLSYDNTLGNIGLRTGALYSHSNNSWDIPLNLQPSDFVSLDSTGLTGARQADGSLPVLNFLKLSSTSAAIDAGTDVGLDYNNAAPDLGFYEYPTFDEAVVPYLNTTYPTFSWSMGITSGGNMLDAGGGTISRKGVCYSTSVDPTTSDNVVEGGVGTDDFISKIWALKPNTTYHVRAFATNEYGTGYGADVEFTTPARSFVMKNKKVIKLNGKIVII